MKQALAVTRQYQHNTRITMGEVLGEAPRIHLTLAPLLDEGLS